VTNPEVDERLEVADGVVGRRTHHPVDLVGAQRKQDDGGADSVRSPGGADARSPNLVPAQGQATVPSH